MKCGEITFVKSKERKEASSGDGASLKIRRLVRRMKNDVGKTIFFVGPVIFFDVGFPIGPRDTNPSGQDQFRSQRNILVTERNLTTSTEAILEEGASSLLKPA